MSWFISTITNLSHIFYDAISHKDDLDSILKNHKYTVLIGPANSGKTTWFSDLRAEYKIYITSVADIDNIVPFNKILRMEDFVSNLGTIINLQDCVNIYMIRTNIMRIVFKGGRLLDFNCEDGVYFKKRVTVFVDEIHFFSKRELKFLRVILDNFKTIYNLDIGITMIPHSHLFTKLPNTDNLITFANDIKVISKGCAYCMQPTVHSTCINKSEKMEVKCGKNMFAACCTECAYKFNNNIY